jgi:glucose/arabinose dehydrogenase
VERRPILGANSVIIGVSGRAFGATFHRGSGTERSQLAESISRHKDESAISLHMTREAREICLPRENGRATGEYHDFLTGVVAADGDVWGCPVGVTVAPDGSLLITGDGVNCIWRVSYGAR